MTLPQLSVVIPSVNGLGDLIGCLEALEGERRATVLEVLVVDRLGAPVVSEVARRFPWVRILPTPPGTTIPAMRAIAFDAATAPSVAVIEDHVLVPSGWARQLLAAQARGEEVVGGAVENAATERLTDWAAFLCEYHAILPPLPDGPANGITGNNTVYRRELLVRFRDVVAEGRWENRLHDALRGAGIALYCRPDIRVGHKKHYTVWEYLSQRFLYSRSYAGARALGRPLGWRLAAGAAAFLLPALLYVRVVTTVWRKGVHRPQLVRSLPLLGLFVTSWGLGEVVGYWAGPGNALSKVC